MAHRIEMTEVQGSPMEVFIFEPEGAGSRRAIATDRRRRR